MTELGEYCPLCGEPYANHPKCDGCGNLVNPDLPNSQFRGHCSGKGVKREKFLFCPECSKRLDRIGVLRLGNENIVSTLQGIKRVGRKEMEGVVNEHN